MKVIYGEWKPIIPIVELEQIALGVYVQAV